MAWRTLLLLSLTALIAGGTVAVAQPASAPKDQTAQPDRIAHVTLGQAVVPLFGPWKFTVGDSPIDPKTGKPLWAEPDFDGSKWEAVDLTPKEGAVDPNAEFSSYVPGWTARGHAGYGGWAWYRLRVRVAAVPGEQMAIDGPMADDAWQLFAEGKLQGSFGKFDNRGDVRRIYGYRPLMIPLPPLNVLKAAW
jgi:hypothetical protein